MFELVVNTYNSLKFVHVLSAVVWVGGACTVQTFAIRISATGDGARMATFAKDAEFVGNRIFLPSSIILLVSGIFTIHESSGAWSYDQTWVQIGLAHDRACRSRSAPGSSARRPGGSPERSTQGGVESAEATRAHQPHLPRVAVRARAAACS